MVKVYDLAPNVISEGKMRHVDVFVEATDNEKFALWKQNHFHAVQRDYRHWADDGRGYLLTLAHYYGKPICISVLFATISGRRVVFWEAVSGVVKHDIIDAWFKKHFPNTVRTNAMNFHNAFGER